MAGLDEKTENWIIEAMLALESAATISVRSCRPGDGLNLANHARLVREAKEMLGEPWNGYYQGRKL